MKKKVRIYKAPDGKGKFVNKTAKFLYGGMPKAQEGMQADPMAAMTDYVYKTLDDIEFFEDAEEVKESLVDELTTANVPIEKAEELVSNIAQQVLLPKFPEAQTPEVQETVDTEETEEPESETDYGYYDDTAADGEDEDDEDDDDIPEEAYMQYGGDIIPEDNAVTFTGYDAGTYVADKQQTYALGGMTKRKYVGKVMKLLKKAQEGIQSQEEEETKFDPTDTMDFKKQDLNKGFVSALANSALDAKRKEQAEAMWQQQQELMAQQQNPEMTPEGAPMARRGFATGEEYLSPRQIRRMMPRGLSGNQMRSFAGFVPPGGMFPGGINIMTMPQANMQMPEQKPIHVQGTLPGMKIDVRKSHWLTGKPSQYSIEYGGDFAIPGFNMMPGGGFSTKSTSRRTIEGVSRIVNKKADPGKNNTTVLNNNPEYDKDGNGVPDNIQSNIIPSTPGTPTAYDKNANNMLDVTEVKTNLPAVNNNPNKDAVGSGAKLPAKTTTNKVTTNTSSKNAGQNKTTTNTTASNKKTTKLSSTLPNSSDKKKVITSADIVKKQSGWKKPGPSNVKSNPIASSPSSFYEQPLINAMNWVRENTGLTGSFEDTWGSLFGYESGGFVDSSNPELYKFIYGGDDSITQQDMDYADSKNSGSPFFAQGGGSLRRYDKGDEVKEDDYTKYLRERAESEALDEYNKFMNRTEKDQAKFKKFDANTNDSVYNRILTENRKKYNVSDPNAKPGSSFSAITSKEDYDKKLAEERKKWEEEYSQDDQGYNTSYNPYAYNSNFRPNAFQKYVPFNTVRKLGTWSQQVGMPYDPRTGKMVNAFGPNTNLTKIDVRKSGWLSGDPKKYTMYFNNYNVDPKLAKFLEETHGADPSKQPVKDKSKATEDSKVTKPEDSNVIPEYKPGSYGPGFSGYNADSDGDGVPDFMQANDPQDGKRKPFEIGDALTPSIPARPMSQIPSSFEDDENFDPEGIKTYGSPEAANEYIQGEWGDIMADVSEVLGPQSQQEFDEFLATNPTKGAIDAKIEDFMRQRNEAIYKDAEAVEREDLTANAEEEIMNQQAMRRNPMFMGSSGAPAANPNFGATPEIATGQDYQLSDREKADMDYFMQNRRSAPIDFQPRSGTLTESNIFRNRDQVIPNTRKPSEDLANLIYTDSLPALPASPLETKENYEDMLLSGFPQYTGAFEGAASNDEQYLPGTFNDLSEGSIRNREIAAKQLYNQQQAAIRQQQLIQQQQQQAASNSESESNASSNAALKEKALNSNRQAKQSGDWRDTWDIKGVINKNKNQLETLKDSPIGQKTLFAIDSRWENMSESQRKAYGSFDKYLKTEGYDEFYNTMQGKIGQIAKAKKKKKQFGGILNRFNNGGGNPPYADWAADEDTDPYDKNNNGVPDVTEVSTNLPKATPKSTSINLNSNFAPKKDSQGNVIIPGFNTAESMQNNKMKNSLLSYQGYGEGDEFSAAPEGSAVTVDDEGNPIVMSPDEAYRRLKEGEIAVDMENKDTYEVDARGTADLFNYVTNNALGRVGRYQAMQPFADFYTNNFNMDNIHASQDRRDRGMYDTNAGYYKPNKQGPTDMNTTVTRYGGFMRRGGITVGEVVDMTPDEIAEFLANGGELEIIS